MPDTARTALVAGATGLVGGQLLRQLLADPAYTRVVALVRRPLDERDPKLEARVVDFARLTPAELPRADDAYCALGTTMRRAGSRAAFRAVDHDAVLALARAAATAGAGASQFLLVSALGANPASRNFYLQVKGEAERDVAALPFRAVHVFRPSLLTGARAEFRAAERIGIILATAVAPLMVGGLRRYRPIAADVVARALRAAARHGGTGVIVYESERIAGLGAA
jgi:uncharacterized protein YbjT (DUF2867 family)